MVHAHVQDVATRHGLVGHVQLLGQPAAAHHADLDAVQGDDGDRLDAVEPQVDPVAEPVGEVERDAVVAGRVLVGHVRRLDGEREVDVRVDRPPPVLAPLEHPMAGDGDRVPARVVEVDGLRAGRREVGTRRVAESPGAAQVYLGRRGGHARTRLDAAPGARRVRGDGHEPSKVLVVVVWARRRASARESPAPRVVSECRGTRTGTPARRWPAAGTPDGSARPRRCRPRRRAASARA